MLGLKDQMIALIENYGVIALFLSLTLETLGLPLPGESALITAAATAGPGGLNIWNVAIAAYVAAVVVPLLIVAMIGLVWWSRRRDSDITGL